MDAFLEHFERSLLSISEVLSKGSIDADEIDTCILRCARILEDIDTAVVKSAESDTIGSESQSTGELSSSVSNLMQTLLVLSEEQESGDVNSIIPVRPAHRPKQNIEKNQLMFLIQCGFTNKDISHLMKCSTKTIQRRIVEFGLSALKKYSVITDCELDRLTTAYVDKYPASGGNSYHAFLDSQGIKLQRQGVRDSMLRVDEDGVRCRFVQAIKRRSYHVEMPNSLWHIDGYHKLIQWHIVIHGGLDGYSRIPVFLCASNNNQASTVLHDV